MATLTSWTQSADAPVLDGYCPVELSQNETWAQGDRRWAVVHRGRTYLLSGPQQQQSFLANPDRYVPVLGGLDPVLSADEHRMVSGQTQHCVVYDGRLYMFASASTLAQFRQNLKRYTSSIPNAR